MIVHKEIANMVEDIFIFAHDPQYENLGKMQFAKMAGLSYSTLYNLRRGTTRDPRYSTILKLCRAVGLGDVLKKQLGAASTRKHKGYAPKMRPIVKFRKRA